MEIATVQQRVERAVNSVVRVGGAVTVTVATIGVLMILSGAALQTGVWAGMLGVMGGMFVFLALLGRGLVELYRLL